MITVSLEMAKKLKEAGFPQESHYGMANSGATYGYPFKKNDWSLAHSRLSPSVRFAAPTMQEVWELFPKQYSGCRLSIDEYRGQLGYFKINFDKDPFVVVDIDKDNITESLAKLWLRLEYRMAI